MLPAETLWLTGGSHLLAAEELTAREGENAFNGKFSPSIFLLLGFSLELLLKAVFIQLGGTEKRARTVIGHKLIVALDEAEKVGFQPPGPALRELVVVLHETHAENFFRYMPDTGDRMLPRPEEAVPLVRQLFYEVATLLPPEARQLRRSHPGGLKS